MMGEMMEKSKANAEEYEAAYNNGERYLKWPSSPIIRYWAYSLRKSVPSGRVLDFGCGSGNNAYFMALQGYDVYAVDASAAAIRLLRRNFKQYGLDVDETKVGVVLPEARALPYLNDYFDVIIANQSLYYLVDSGQIQDVVAELWRITRPGGQIFATMLSAQNIYMTHYLTGVNADIAEITVDNGRLKTREFVYKIRDETHLKEVFMPFSPICVGWFDECLLGQRNHHHIFIGKKPA